MRCVSPAMAAERRGPAHKSRTHRLLGPHKQADGSKVLALSHGRWKLPDDQFDAFLEHYVAEGELLRLCINNSVCVAVQHKLRHHVSRGCPTLAC